MPVTPASPFKSAPRISEDTFVRVLRDAGSFTAGDALWRNLPSTPEATAHVLYQFIANRGHDPGVWLAICGREHTYGTNRDSVLWRNDTRSWTNARTVRDPAIRDHGVWQHVTDPVRRSQYVKYRNVIDSVQDGLYRVDDPTYAYKDAHSISDVIHVWTESEGDAYTQYVVDRLNAWADAGEDPPMAGDDTRFQWVPDVSEFGYPQGAHGRNGKPIDYLIVHITEGSDSLGWLTGGNGSSAHYLTRRDATPRAQMVREADAAWTAGNREYNERGINIEFERFAKDAWTDAEYRNAAATVYPILKRHNIPLVYLGRDSAGKRGILGHQDVPDGKDGWGGTTHHTDPGKAFDWNAFIGYLTALDAGSTPTPPPPASGQVVIPRTQPDPWKSPHGQFWIADAFVEHIRAGDWMTVGYAVSPGIAENGLFVQYFERARLELHGDTVMRGLIGLERYRDRYGDA